jgi:hypothetical protein
LKAESFLCSLDVLGRKARDKKSIFGTLVWKPPSFLEEYENGIN